MSSFYFVAVIFVLLSCGQSLTQWGRPRAAITKLSASYSNNPDFLSRVSRIGKNTLEGASSKIARIFSAETATNAKLAAALDMDEKEVKFVRDMGDLLARGLDSQRMALDHAMNVENRLARLVSEENRLLADAKAAIANNDETAARTLLLAKLPVQESIVKARAEFDSAKERLLVMRDNVAKIESRLMEIEELQNRKRASRLSIQTQAMDDEDLSVALPKLSASAAASPSASAEDKDIDDWERRFRDLENGSGK